jgi:hypothetical protein
MGIVMIELLISGSMPTAAPEDFPFKARELVDSKDSKNLPAAIEAMAVDGGWADESAVRAAKILTSVAVSCTCKTEMRLTQPWPWDGSRKRTSWSIRTTFVASYTKGRHGSQCADWSGWCWQPDPQCGQALWPQLPPMPAIALILYICSLKSRNACWQLVENRVSSSVHEAGS